MENKRKSAPKKESGAKSENSKGKRASASAGRQPEKKGAAKKTAKKTAAGKPIEKKPAAKGGAGAVKAAPNGEAAVGVRSTLTSVVLWTVIFAIALMLIGLNVFNTRPVPLEEAAASINVENEARYGAESRLTLSFDKPVDFDGETEIVWIVDGTEVKRSAPTDKDGMTLSHRFSSVGGHNVTVKAEGKDTLTVSRDIDVKKPLLTLTARNARKTYGEANPDVIFQVSGFVDGDTQDSVQGLAPRFDADEKSPVGEYGVAALTLGKYDVAVSGKLTVTPKEISIAAENLAKVYDGSDAAPETEFSLRGAVGGDDVSVVCGSAKFGDKNAGVNKKVTFDGLRLAGKDAANYRLDGTTLKGEILPKEITLDGAEVSDKQFDGGTAATFKSLGRFTGVVEGDEISVGEVSARFENASAGKGKTVIIDKCVIRGKDAANYKVKLPLLKADINN